MFQQLRSCWNIEVLRRCWKRQFIWDQGRRRFRQREELSKDDMLESPYDVDARYSTKRGRECTLGETCDDDLPHLEAAKFRGSDAVPIEGRVWPSRSLPV